MKIITYKVLGTITEAAIDGEENEEVSTRVLSTVRAPYSPEAEAIAEATAYLGEYTIEDDGTPEPTPEGDVWSELDTAYSEGYREGVNAV